ncbi:MAG: prepilin-type N-terminal cleavage/methylation domain-containing protein [Kiritimatiellia bacterium]|nr:prepilin-type N-terminal cleavage/methylation domain-containing protein [Kiritimatiellia bacterium]
MKMNKKGFTLVEIMIVVLIIGLLAAIAIPSFTRARSRARANTCVNNLRLIDSAKEQFAMETNLNAGAAVTVANVSPFMRNSVMPTCPEGNVAYTDTTVGNVGAPPTCPSVATFATHVLP